MSIMGIWQDVVVDSLEALVPSCHSTWVSGNGEVEAGDNPLDVGQVDLVGHRGCVDSDPDAVARPVIQLASTGLGDVDKAVRAKRLEKVVVELAACDVFPGDTLSGLSVAGRS
jgi:hypothetical protein